VQPDRVFLFYIFFHYNEKSALGGQKSAFLNGVSNIVGVIGLGLTGALSGFIIPYAAQKFSTYKSIAERPRSAPDRLYTSARVKVIICLFSAAVWALAAAGMDSVFWALLVSLLFGLSVLTALVDLKANVIPNELVLALSAVGMVFQCSYYGYNSLLVSIFCMLVIAGLFTIVAGALGFGKVGAGDVKLSGVMGLILGYPNIIAALTIMSLALLIYSMIGFLTRRLTLRSMLPLAPFMMLGMLMTLIFIIL